MTTTTGVFLPDEQEGQLPKKPSQSVRQTSDGAVRTEPAQPDAEIRKLNEEELKAAIVSAWKNLERIHKKEMGGLLYWLREKLRAQGSRNDRHDQKGFGAWVQKTIEISRRTADRWADSYGLQHGLLKRKSTSRHDDQKLFSTDDDDFYAQELRRHGRQIQMNYWVSRGVFQQYESAIKILKRQFKTSSNQEATLKGVLYAAQELGRGRGTSVGKAKSRRVVGHKQKAVTPGGHRTRRGPEVNRANARPKAFRAAAG